MAKNASVALPPILYHYCSLESAIAILESQTLRLSSMLHLNDGLEFKWLQRMLLERIAEKYGDQFDKSQILAKNFTSLYCFSMSTEEDSLAQWRAYGKDGYGVALGLNTKHFRLSEGHGCWELDRRHQDVELAPVNYDVSRHKELIDHMVEASLAIEPLEGEDPVDSASTTAQTLLYSYAGRCKNPAFGIEREWRFIYRHNSLAPTFFGSNDPLSTLGVAVRGNTLVPFYSLSFDKTDHEEPPFVRVMLGPNVNAETEETLKMFLEDRSYKRNFLAGNSSLRIDRSVASYRTL